MAEGVLLKAYDILPTNYLMPSEFGADDAVTNNLTHTIINVATGGWSSRNNPLSNYTTWYSALIQVNIFLENVDQVKWSSSEIKKNLFRDRLKGEAYGLRAYLGYLLLQEVGGKSETGELLGYPIVTSSTLDTESAKLPRNTYADCVAQIFDDCNKANELLPLRWTDEGLNSEEKETKGARYHNRINGITTKLIKARVALTAASDAFKESGITMQETAELAAEIIALNGFDKMDAKDVQFYLQARTSNLSYFDDNSEVFWYSTIVPQKNAWESDYYPPSLNGKGLVSPSQNLVDAFGDKTGNPMSVSTLYDPANPYQNRDPRLDKYIFHNNSKTDKNIILNLKNGDKDPVGKTIYSTRTGYYMRKLLDGNVVLPPTTGVVSTPHYYVYARFTEALLIFAEAANQVVGPDGSIGGFTARDIINRIRTRAGITSTNYVDGLDATDLASLIRNERRIELCFEGFRFWDLRRWSDLTTMNETVRGLDLQTLTSFDVEQRNYEPYMIYGPIPYSETLKYNIIQNRGWD
nr:RagB/SusD family nutrient uptake outer membrane protein [Proteiniphilum sp. UBA5384]